MRLLIKRKKKEKKRMVSETLAVISILGDITQAGRSERIQ
jgi:predicted DNA-binding protein with PD1-like motif